jgi:hypothetical protein
MSDIRGILSRLAPARDANLKAAVQASVGYERHETVRTRAIDVGL